MIHERIHGFCAMFSIEAATTANEREDKFDNVVNHLFGTHFQGTNPFVKLDEDTPKRHAHNELFACLV